MSQILQEVVNDAMPFVDSVVLVTMVLLKTDGLV